MLRRGFSLLEVLIVIAIIALLAGLLFPVYGRARDNTRRRVCAAHLKQIGLAIQTYAGDYDDMLPPSRYIAPRATWAALIQPYLGSWKVLRCPNMRDAGFGGTSIWSPPLAVPGNLSVWPAYGLNVDYLARAHKSDCSDFNRPFPGTGPPASTCVVAQPAQTVLVTGISFAPGPGSWAGVNSLHPEGGGYYVAPAPATVGSRDSCTLANGGWGEGSYLGPYGGFESVRHGGRGLVLFLDGRTRAMTPEQLAAGTNWTPTTRNDCVLITERLKYLWDLE